MAGKKAVAAPTEEVTTPAPVEEVATPPVQEEEVVALERIPKGSTAIANLNDIQSLALADADEDLGFEKGDVAIPFFRILQSNSPQVKRQNAKYVTDAEQGNFFNTATNRIWNGDTGVHVIPVAFMRQATLWLPRGEGGTAGGGFIKELTISDAEELLKLCTKSAKNKDLTPAMQLGSMARAEQLELVIAAMYYLILFNPESPDEYETVGFPLVSTQMKKARQWNAIIKNSRLPNPSGVGTYRPAMFGFSYKLTTVPESNVHGEWMGVRITQDKPLIKYVDGSVKEMFRDSGSLYLVARDFAELVKSGQAKVKPEQEIPDDGGSMGDDPDEKPPF